MPRGGFCFGAGEGATAVRSRGGALSSRTQPRRSLVLPTQCASERTFSFVVENVRDAACGGEKPGEAPSAKPTFSWPGRRRGPGSFARGGRVPVRRRTRRFGHAALPPCSVFAPRRTTRRQCRGLFSFHRAAGRAKQGSAPPCFCFARAAAPLPPRRRCDKINRIYPKMRLCRRRRFSWPRPS